MDHNRQIQQFYMVGLSYEKADVQTRGEFAFFPSWIPNFTELLQQEGINDYFVLSTCNRTEIYFLNQNAESFIQLYCRFLGKRKERFLDVCTVLNGTEAIQHFFRVSSGLDSQILGDFEVIAQIKTWAKKFKKANTLNSFFERLINTSIQISKEIKNQTSLSSGVASVSYAAVQYILDTVENSNHKNILLYGIGKIGRNTCENLHKHLPNKEVTLINRTPEKAENLSEKLDFKSESFENLNQAIQNTDILIVATGAQKPTITKDNISGNKKLLILDLSIPENVAKEVHDLEQVTVVNVDMLSDKVNKTMSNRAREIPKAETIIQTHLNEFMLWLEDRKFAPEIQAFKEKLLFLQKHELQNLRKKHPQINGKETMLSNQLVQKLTNRFATHLLENKEDAESSIQLINQIFGLEQDATTDAE